jgi:type IV pilus assembly protein PilM
MLGFVQSWFTPGANPIGVDFGSDSLRMAQVELVNGEFKLVAAARADVPARLRHDPAARFAFFTENIRDLWSQGNFRGRRAILALPAASMTIQHLRVARMDEEALKKALPWEAQGKLPYDPTRAVLRHLVAGDIYQDGEQKNEVILMAANREMVNQYLAAAARGRLDVVGMNVEPKVLVDCFTHIYRRKTDAEITNCFVDIGCSATRAIVARGGQIMFARSIPVGGEHFTRAVASALQISSDDARLLRLKQAQSQVQSLDGSRGAAPETAAAQSVPDSATTSAPSAAPVAEVAPAAKCTETDRIEQACAEPVERLIAELSLCRRYHDATFPNLPLGRLIFVGGEARQKNLCQRIAQGLNLAAQLGDPMVRMGRISEVSIESGIDRRLPQPDWAVAIGLSMGPATVAQPEAAVSK